MADWKERMRHADQERLIEEQKKRSEEIIKQKNSADSLAEDEKRWEKERNLNIQILERFKIKSLLEGIREDVWGHMGTIILRGSSNIRLEYKYSSPTYYTHETEAGTGPSIFGGVTETSSVLEVSIEDGKFFWVEDYKKKKWSLKEGNHLRVFDSKYTLGPIAGADTFKEIYGTRIDSSGHHWVKIDSASEPEGRIPKEFQIAIDDQRSQEILEEVLLRSCILRKNNNSLPFQLKAEADRAIDVETKTNKKPGWISRIIKGR